MPSPSDEGDAPTVPEELLPVKRGPGRPLGAKNKDRVSSIERINREATRSASASGAEARPRPCRSIEARGAGRNLSAADEICGWRGVGGPKFWRRLRSIK
jgi:hypothetical protein